MELAEKEWFRKLKVLRGWLAAHRDRGGAGQDQRRHRSGRRPGAGHRSEGQCPGSRSASWTSRPCRTSSSPTAARVLAVDAIEDQLEEVRLTALEHLQKKKQNPEIVSYFISRLRDKDNRKVNRAGVLRAGPT